MATRSTASSGTDPQEPQEPVGAPGSPDPSDGPKGPAHDASRRAFFFQFGRQAASAATQVVGMADVVGRTSNALAGELLGLDERAPAAGKPVFSRAGAAANPVVSPAPPAAEDAFRSAYRLSDEGLVLLDQRRVPEALEEVVARRGSDVAYYLRLGVARGGPLMAQAAAYGLWLTAVERASLASAPRATELRRSEQALLDARPSSRLLASAVESMRAVIDGLGPDAPGDAMAAALRTAADAIATEATATEALLADRLEAVLPAPDGRPLGLLLHGGQGALVAGQLGATLVALRRMQEAGRELRVFLTEGRPFMDGARLAAWELRQAGIEHRIVADSAVAWLFAREPIDAVVVRAEWVAANGDTAALIGARALAQLAAAAGDADAGDGAPRVLVLTPPTAVADDTPDGAAIPVELRPARELAAYLAGTPVRTSDALVPAADVIPAGLIDAYVDTEARGA